MTTLQLSLLSPDNSISLRLVSPVKTSANQDPKKGLKRTPDRAYSSRSSDSFASADPVTSYWKTSQLCFLATEVATWEQYSGSFPKSGTMRSGKLFRQTHWGPITSEKDCGLLPTPTASDNVYRKGTNIRTCKKGGFYLKTTQKEKSAARLTSVLDYLNRPDLATSPTFREEMMGYPEGWTCVND